MKWFTVSSTSRSTGVLAALSRLMYGRREPSSSGTGLVDADDATACAVQRQRRRRAGQAHGCLASVDDRSTAQAPWLQISKASSRATQPRRTIAP